MSDMRECPRCYGSGKDRRGGSCFFCRGTGETTKFTGNHGLLSWLFPISG